ncbi:MAG: NAD(P)-dependent oxidoreductase [Desulfobacteria bacterium]
MSVIAITGTSGFLGTHLLKHLSSWSNLHLKLMVHNNADVPLNKGTGISLVQGDLLKPETLNGFIEAGCTVVNLVHLSGRPKEENFTAMVNLAEACGRVGIKRLIHCSTAVVSGRLHVDRVTEDTPTHPLKEYEITKEGVEKILLEKSKGLFEAVILRPTAIFGMGGKNLLKMADDLRCGNRAVNYLKSCVFQYRRMNLVSIENVVSAIAFLIFTDSKIDREVFIISEDEDPFNNYHDVERYLMKRLGYRAYQFPVIPLSFLILKILLRLSGRTNINPALVYDCGNILSAGFKKPLSFQEGLSRFADWYQSTHS